MVTVPVEVVPAILVRSYDELSAALQRIQGTAPVVQVDVIDGAFAPGTTWPLRDEVHFPLIASGEEGMPLWESFDFEFDLMLTDPAADIDSYVAAGASRIVLHTRSDTTPQALGRLQLPRQSEYPVSVGVALTSAASASDLAEFENQYDYIQIMGIRRLGVQGSQLSPDVYELIKELRRVYPDKTIQVDGGVRLENCANLISAGANRIVSGSAIFNADDPKQAYEELRAQANA
jgi:ribulose-phosphate 3-epimerase